MSKTVNLFEEEVIKGLQGATPKTTSKNIRRFAESNIKGQISALDGSIIKKEIALENAEEKARKTFYATTIAEVEDGDVYLQAINKADKAVETAQKDLDDTKALKTKLEGYLDRFKDVEAPTKSAK